MSTIPAGAVCAALLLSLMSAPVARAAEPLALLHGSDFAGGAAAIFGSVQYGMPRVNYVYARSNGAASEMAATFQLNRLPEGPLALYVLARDNNLGDPCPVEVLLNDTVVLAGVNDFPRDRFAWQEFPLVEGTARAGENMLKIANLSPEGPSGNVPWFMVARCMLAEPGIDPEVARILTADFHVSLPEREEPFPRPLPEGAEPGFALRGTKGWLWTPEQYFEELPHLVATRMNFLMICYGSLFDIENFGIGDPRSNRWWEPLPEEKRARLGELLAACQESGVDLCLSVNPNLWSERVLDYASDEDFEALWQHYDWFQKRGMRWFSLSLDDIVQGVDPAGQSDVVNRLLARLRERDPEAQLIFCPTVYWGNGEGTGTGHAGGYGDFKVYLNTLRDRLHEDVFLFWTGDSVTGVITREGAEGFRRQSGHRLILWDNYPVNDSQPALHLGPLTKRDPDLNDVVHGYMSNPMHRENQINRIPLYTCADYAWNPRAYDPAWSIGQALLRHGDTQEQREVLRDLVELYPGFVLWGGGTGTNAAVERLHRILAIPHSRCAARAYVAHARSVATRMAAAFPEKYVPARRRLEADIEGMEAVLASQ